MALLEYVLSDVNPADPAGAADLEGVPLVPLADGTLGRFAFLRSEGEPKRPDGEPKRPPPHAKKSAIESEARRT